MTDMNRSTGQLRNDARAQAFTVLEVTLAMFVLVFGLLGILALFPVGLNSSKMCVEFTNAAIIGQSALEYVRMDPMVRAQWPDYPQPDDASGTVAAMNSGTVLRCEINGASPGWSTGVWASPDHHILRITSGPYTGKIYEIWANTADTLTCSSATFDYNETGNGDDIYAGTNFVILGKVGNTIPADFFTGHTPRYLSRNEILDAPDFIVPSDANADSEYSIVCILSGHLPGTTETARADILIYRHFNETFRPESVESEPPIKVFVTYLSRN